MCMVVFWVVALCFGYIRLDLDLLILLLMQVQTAELDSLVLHSDILDFGLYVNLSGFSSVKMEAVCFSETVTCSQNTTNSTFQYTVWKVLRHTDVTHCVKHVMY
jgi:hypothetical protein